MSKTEDKVIEQKNRLASDDKLRLIEEEEYKNKFANKFNILEEDNYEKEERAYRLAAFHQFDGFRVFSI